MNRKVLVAPLGALFMAAGVTNAHAVIVGDPAQSNSQSATTNQSINQSSGGGVVVGPTVQTGVNTSVTALTNSQTVPGGGAIVGSPAQSSAQSSATNQGVSQATGGGATIGPVVQTAFNTAVTGATNVQLITGGGVVVGSPRQSNAQSAATNQAAAQSTGHGVFAGTLLQTAVNTAPTVLFNLQTIGGGGAIVGSPAQSSAQSGATGQAIGQASGGGIVVSPITLQTGVNTGFTTETNIAVIV